MKFLRLVCLSLVFCMACTQNKDEIEIVQKLQEEQKKELFLTEPVKDEKEQVMYMTSFLIGKTLIENKEARDYFYQFIVHEKITKIELAKILNSDYIDSNPFEAAFHQQFNKYNWHTSSIAGGPVPPTTSAVPDAIKWGGILDAQMHYHQYLVEIIDNRKLELYFSNKNSYLNEFQDLSYYFENNNSLTCLWSLNYFSLYSDGLILNTDGSGNYLPEDFDPATANSLIFILRDKIL